MHPTTISSAPGLDSFTSLEDHQSQTPTTFYGTKPVLHHHISGASVLIANDQRAKLPVFYPANPARHEEAASNDGDHSVEDVTVDVYVSSESFLLFNTNTSTGVSIPYPAIALHAVQRLPPSSSSAADPQQAAHFGLLMNIELESQPPDSIEDEEISDDLELTLVPPSHGNASHDVVQALFAAISTCSNLHPDPASQGDGEEMNSEEWGTDRIMFEGSVGYEGFSGQLPGVIRGASDGGLPPPFPGSGGWITAENVGEYFDEEGNWRGGQEGEGDREEVEVIGEGAGRVRGRDEEANHSAEINGHREEEEEDHKRQRTE